MVTCLTCYRKTVGAFRFYGKRQLWMKYREKHNPEFNGKVSNHIEALLLLSPITFLLCFLMRWRTRSSAMSRRHIHEHTIAIRCAEYTSVKTRPSRFPAKHIYGLPKHGRSTWSKRMFWILSSWTSLSTTVFPEFVERRFNTESILIFWL